MANIAISTVFSVIFQLGTVPEDYRAAGIQGNEQVLEAMVFDVPDSLLVLLRVSPDCHTVVLALLSAAIGSHIRSLGDAPDPDTAFNTSREE